MDKVKQTSALRRIFDKVRSIPGHVLDSYEQGFKNVEAAHDQRDQAMKDSNGLSQKEGMEADAAAPAVKSKPFPAPAVMKVGKRLVK